MSAAIKPRQLTMTELLWTEDHEAKKSKRNAQGLKGIRC